MQRRAVKVIKSRLEDVEVGDVVNRQPDAEMGWFTVADISTLFNGHLQLADETEQLTVSGDHKDMVGLQLVEEVPLDDRGIVAPPAIAAAPPVVAAPHVVVAEPAPIDATPALAADHPRSAGIPVNGSSDPSRPPDLAAEVAAAADVATNMNAPAGGGPHVPDGVNLALVAELLEDLDIGDAPAITTQTGPLDAAAPAPAPIVPEGARPVYGNELPATPSYKNPVVLPEGTQLPRRSRAA